jgi:hypothetical protein
MAYFLFSRRNPFFIHEIYPSLLMPHTGVTITDPVYLEGLQAVKDCAPLYALEGVGEEKRFLTLELMRHSQDPGNPLLDYIHEYYEPIRAVPLDAGNEPWIILLKRRPAEK